MVEEGEKRAEAAEKGKAERERDDREMPPEGARSDAVYPCYCASIMSHS